MIGRLSIRIVVLGLLAVGLTACAQYHPEQPKGTAIVRLGGYDSTVQRDMARDPLKASELAGYYVPYALMAVRAYGDADAAGERWQALIEDKDDRGRPLAGQVAAWLADWHHAGSVDNPRAQHHENGPLTCGRDRKLIGQCLFNLPGMAYEIWVRKQCREVVLAFRGTDFREINDWLTNFHWFLRLLPINDQYEQVQDHTRRLVDQMRRLCGGKSPLITAVGHSLGGGLAQQAAYVDNRITRVIAFDPSIVTGYHDVHSDTRDLSRLKIDRVYEHGEVLAYLRFVQRQFAPASACNPQIRTIRVNLDRGSVVSQHSMATFAANLVRAAGTPRDWQARRKYVLPESAPDLCHRPA
ncbi:MAG TPA: lipase [Beijerinckiaceae bacterium]|nr:lipase [Beijerinckiaceae bacterium]